MARRATLALAALLAAGLAPAPAAAQDQATSEVHEFDASPADTVVFELTTEEGFKLTGDSNLTVTGWFDEPAQRISMVAGVVHEAGGVDCSNLCAMGMATITAEDAATSLFLEDNGDLRADTGPRLDVALETGHDHGAADGVILTVGLAGLSLPDTSPGNTSYHVFASIPKAVSLEGGLNVTAEGDVNVTGQRIDEAGFSYWTDDMRAAGVHTAAASAYTGDDRLCGTGCGQVPVDPAEGQRVYGVIGPTGPAEYVVHDHYTRTHCWSCLGPFPTPYHGEWGVSGPGFHYQGSGTAMAAGATAGPQIAVPGFADEPGDGSDDAPARFYVDRYASVGPHDLVASGFVSPLDPVAE